MLKRKYDTHTARCVCVCKIEEDVMRVCNARFNCTKKGYKGNHRTKFAHTNHKLSREEHVRVANRCFFVAPITKLRLNSWGGTNVLRWEKLEALTHATAHIAPIRG